MQPPAAQGDKAVFGRRYWADVDGKHRSTRLASGLAMLTAALAGVAAVSWAALTGFNPLWWRVTVWAAIASAAALCGRARYRDRRRR